MPRIHVHFQSNPEAPPVFHLTSARYRAAARRNPDAARRVKATIAETRSGFYQAMKTADVLVGWGFPRKDLASVAPRLKWIHVIGAGIEHLMPLDWLPPSVGLVNNSGVHAQKAGEYIQMSLLMLNNAIPTLVTSQQKREWNEVFSTSIAGKTLLVIGVGRMGGAGAKAAKRLSMKVTGVRRTPRPHRFVDEMHETKALPKVLPRADFVLVTVPVTPETRGLLGRRELDLMKPTAGLINLGRAEIVDYEALREKLHEREIGGAVLDVFDPEPLPASSPLWTTPNLVITPHVASDDRDAYVPLTMDLVLENVARFLARKPLKNRVSRTRGY